MKLIVTLSGEFSDSVDDGVIKDLRDDLDDMARMDYGGSGIVIEVTRA